MDIRCCDNCIYNKHSRFGGACFGCNNYSKWEAQAWLKNWIESFDTTSATVCFTEVNLLKQRLEGDK